MPRMRLKLALLAIGLVMFAGMVWFATPVPDQYAREDDRFALICKPLPRPYYLKAPMRAQRWVSEECRLAKYWAVADGHWRAK